MCRDLTHDRLQAESMDISLSVGAASALLKPKLVALGAIAAMLMHGTIVVERVETQCTVAA